MRLILGADSDPSLEQILLRCRKCLLGLGRRHDFFRVGREDVLDQFAFGGLSRDDGFMLKGDFTNIKPQLGFALVFVRPMAGVAVFG